MRFKQAWTFGKAIFIQMRRIVSSSWPSFTAEFEAIHPFLDGNGRLGRLIVPLFLSARGLLSRPNFYLSEFLEANREEYYDRLLAISGDDDWTGWCAFFLRGLIDQAESNSRKAEAILKLHQERRDWIVGVTRSQYAVRALDWMFVRPIFKAPDFVASADIPEPTARGIVRALPIEACSQRSLRQQVALLQFSLLRNCSTSQKAGRHFDVVGNNDNPACRQ